MDEVKSNGTSIVFLNREEMKRNLNILLEAIIHNINKSQESNMSIRNIKESQESNIEDLLDLLYKGKIDARLYKSAIEKNF